MEESDDMNDNDDSNASLNTNVRKIVPSWRSINSTMRSTKKTTNCSWLCSERKGSMGGCFCCATVRRACVGGEAGSCCKASFNGGEKATYRRHSLRTKHVKPGARPTKTLVEYFKEKLDLMKELRICFSSLRSTMV